MLLIIARMYEIKCTANKS